MSTALKVVSGFQPLSSLPHLRTTGIRKFLQCQHTWALDFLMPNVNTDNKWSKIGTAAHYVVEHTMRSAAGLDHATEEEIAANFNKIPAEETEALSWYIGMLLELPYKKILGIEEVFEIDIEGVGMKVKGTLDLILEMEDGCIMIIDHKTNRQYEGLSYWKADLQPLLYSLAMRRLYPGRTIYYKLGYINLSQKMGTVDWETDPSEDEHIEETIRRVWKDMTYNEWRGVWPMTVHEECKYCKLYKDKTCVEHNYSIAAVNQQMTMKMTSVHPTRKIEMLKAFIEYATDVLDEEKNKLKELVVASDNQLVVGDREYYMAPYSERFIEPNDALVVIKRWIADKMMNDINNTDKVNIECGDVLIEALPKLFTAKVGGLDDIEKLDPELGAMLKSVVQKRDYDPRMKTRKLKPSEIAKKVS